MTELIWTSLRKLPLCSLCLHSSKAGYDILKKQFESLMEGYLPRKHRKIWNKIVSSEVPHSRIWPCNNGSAWPRPKKGTGCSASTGTHFVYRQALPLGSNFRLDEKLSPGGDNPHLWAKNPRSPVYSPHLVTGHAWIGSIGQTSPHISLISVVFRFADHEHTLS